MSLPKFCESVYFSAISFSNPKFHKSYKQIQTLILKNVLKKSKYIKTIVKPTTLSYCTQTSLILKKILNKKKPL